MRKSSFGLSVFAKIGMVLAISFLQPFNPAFANSPFTEPLQDPARFKTDERLKSLGNGLAGETISIDDGSLSFSATDVVLPGNSELPVMLTRHYSTENLSLQNGRNMMDWEINVPRIKTRVHSHVGYWHKDRCVGTMYPPTVEDADVFEWDLTHGSGAITIQPDIVTGNEYFGGLNLSVPGKLSSKLLNTQGDPSYLGSPDNIDFSDSPRFVTKEFWKVNCLPQSASDGGDAFVATSPDGTRYIFDILKYEERVMDYVDYPSYYQPSIGAIGPDYIATMYVSKVEDVHGNWVQYSYNDYGPTKIWSNDSRVIDIQYSRSLVSSVTANGRTWQYTYESNNFDYVIRSNLDRVILPDGRYWEYDIAPLLLNNCQALSSVVSMVKHPYGAAITFESDLIGNGIKGVKFVPSIDDPAGINIFHEPNCWGQHTPSPSYMVNYAVTKKIISAPNHPDAIWSYEYDNDGGYFVNPPTHLHGHTILTSSNSPGVSSTKTRKIFEPDGSKRVFKVNREAGWRYGLIEEVQYFLSSSSTIPLKTKAYTYENGVFVGTLELGPNEFAEKNYYAIQTVGETISVDGDVYFTDTLFENDPNANDFSYGKPVRVTRSSSFSPGSRVDEWVYEHNLPIWVLGREKTVLKNAQTISDRTYSPATGQLITVREFGALYNSVSFSYNNDGTLDTITDALGHKIRGSNWKGGRPQTIERAYQSSNEITEYLSVDDNGWVTSQTDANGHRTDYSYDSMGRLALIDRPSPWPTTYVSYSFPSSGGVVQTINKAASRTTMTYDAMVRPVLTHTQALDTGWSSYVRSEYDALGRPIFTSFPSVSSNPTAGTDMTYDALGRMTRSRETVSPFATINTAYLSGHRTQVTDAEGNITTTYRDGYAGPEGGDVIRITQPLGVNTFLYRNILGDVTRVQQSGSHSGYSVDRSQFYFYDSQRRLCRSTTPEGVHTLMTYDAAGQMTAYAKGVASDTTCTVPSGANRVGLSYDALGRLKTTDYQDANTPDITRTYDDNGNLLTLSRGLGAAAVNWTYAYNTLNQLTSEQLSIDGRTYDLSYSYNTSGDLTRRRLPEAGIDPYLIYYDADGLGRPTAARYGSYHYADNITYHPDGSMASMAHQNGTTTTRTLNDRLSPQRLRVASNQLTVLDLTYGYDANNRVTSIIDGAVTGYNRSFGYDPLGQLVSGSGPWGNFSAQYDSLGNLRTRTLSSFKGASRTISLAYNSRNRLSSSADSRATGLGGTGTRTVAYDGRGNVTTLGSMGMVYDRSDQPVAVSGTANGTGAANGTYRYDGNLKRVKAVVNGKTIYNVYDRSGALVHVDEVTDGVKTTYISGPSGPLAKARNGQAVFLHPDPLGSPAVATTTAGAIKWREHYTPFGLTLNDPADTKDQIGFTGHIKDSATGLTYMQARYYDPVIGRFLSVDPVEFLDTGSPAMFNRYAYCYNDPVNCKDPNGEFGFLGAAIGGGFQLAGELRSGSFKDGIFSKNGLKALTRIGGSAAVGAVSGGLGGVVSKSVVGLGGKQLASTVASNAAKNAVISGGAAGSGTIGVNVAETAIDGGVEAAGESILDGSFTDGAGDAALNGAKFGALGSVAGDGVSAALGTSSFAGSKGTLSPGGAAAGAVKGNAVGNAPNLAAQSDPCANGPAGTNC